MAACTSASSWGCSCGSAKPATPGSLPTSSQRSPPRTRPPLGLVVGDGRARPHDLRGRPADHRMTTWQNPAGRRRSEFLGGQFVHAVVAPRWTGAGWSISSGRDGRSASGRTAIGRRSSAYPTGHRGLLPGGAGRAAAATAELSRGGRVVDVHCGGGRWLVAMARRFPQLELVGVEFEADRSLAPGRTSRPKGSPTGSRSAQRKATDPGTSANTTSPTSSTRSTSSPMPRRCCRGVGARYDRVAGSSSSTGRCRLARTSSGPAMARSSPACSSTSCIRERRSRRASSSWPGSRRPGFRCRRGSTCRRALRCSWPSDRPDAGRQGGPLVASTAGRSSAGLPSS